MSDETKIENPGVELCECDGVFAIFCLGFCFGEERTPHKAVSSAYCHVITQVKDSPIRRLVSEYLNQLCGYSTELLVKQVRIQERREMTV